MFFAMLIMFFIFMRVTHGRRRHFAHLHSCSHRGHHRPRVAVPDHAEPKPSAFDQLKQQYVHGDIEVEQYEAALDALLRAPETRKTVI